MQVDLRCGGASVQIPETAATFGTPYGNVLARNSLFLWKVLRIVVDSYPSSLDRKGMLNPVPDGVVFLQSHCRRRTKQLVRKLFPLGKERGWSAGGSHMDMARSLVVDDAVAAATVATHALRRVDAIVALALLVSFLFPLAW